MRNRFAVVLASLACLAGLSIVSAADWPQFLGSHRDGISPEKGLARSWGEAGPKELWKLDLGPGFGAPAVEGGKVYLLDRVGDEKDLLRCIDLKSGHEDWTYGYAAPGKLDYNGSRSVPTVDEQAAYTVGPFGHIHCVNKKTHKVVWQAHVLSDFGGKLPRWGVSQSPLLYKDMVIVAPQSAKAGIVALDKATGKIRWQSPPVGEMAYASPELATIGGIDQIVLRTTDRVVGVAAAEGNVLWTYNGWQCKIPIPGPTILGDGRLFLTGGYGAGCAMIKVEKSGQAFKVVELFKNGALGSQLHNAIYYDGYLYANSNNNNAGLVCMGLDGNVVWKTGGAGGFDMGNLIVADGLIFIMNGATGKLSLVEASPQGFKELGKAAVLSGKPIWAPLAMSDGKLVLRDQKQLKCLDVKGGSAAGQP